MPNGQRKTRGVHYFIAVSVLDDTTIRVVEFHAFSKDMRVKNELQKYPKLYLIIRLEILYKKNFAELIFKLQKHTTKYQRTQWHLNDSNS